MSGRRAREKHFLLGYRDFSISRLLKKVCVLTRDHDEIFGGKFFGQKNDFFFLFLPKKRNV